MRCSVLGAGAWGTAFAIHLARLGLRPFLVPRRSELARALADNRENADYLPGTLLPSEVEVTADLQDSLQGSDVIFFACPSHAIRAWASRVRECMGRFDRQTYAVSLAKGLELDTHRLPSGILDEMLPGVRVAALSGPSNAAEVAAGRPTAMVLAARGPRDPLKNLQTRISGPTLRVYLSDDLAGVEYGGCLKNIYAIAAGCADGLGLGDNARAALLTRSLAEMVRLGQVLGARPETFYGLSGFGDLIATCGGAWSRNRQFGFDLGRGKSVEELLAGRRTVVEGHSTTRSFHQLCSDRRLDAPVLTEVFRMLFENKAPTEVLTSLMGRELTVE